MADDAEDPIVDGDGSDPSGDNTGTKEIEIEGIGKLSVGKIKSLLGKEAELTQKTQELAALGKTVAKYGLTPSQFAQQSDGALVTLMGLVDAGIIDAQGNVVGVQPPAGGDPETRAEAIPLKKEKKMETFDADALVNAVVEKLRPSIEAIRGDTDLLIGSHIRDRLKSQFPGLEDEDCSQIFAKHRAVKQKDPTVKLTTVAQDYVKQRGESEAAVIARFAKSQGLDVSKLKAQNDLRELVSKGGGVPLLQGKKLSLDGREGTIRAKDAALEYLSLVNGREG